MSHIVVRGVRLAVLCGLGVGLAGGCQEKDAPRPAPDGGFVRISPLLPGSNLSFGAVVEREDPEVADYLKKKNWWLTQEVRHADAKHVIFLHIRNHDAPSADVAVTGDDLKMLAKAKIVQVLDLSKVKGMTDEGLRLIAGSPRLEGIVVTGEEVTDAGVKALTRCHSLQMVKLLSTKKVTDAGIKELAALPKLQFLHLSGLTLSGSAFEAFAESKTLQWVDLEFINGLTDEGARHLARLPRLHDLKMCSGPGEKRLTSATIKTIVDTRLPTRFDFDPRLIDDELLKALVEKGWLYGPPAAKARKKPAMPNEVKSIALDGSKVTDNGFQVLLNCTNVTSLNLQRTAVTDETLKQLGGFKNLNRLALGGTKVTGAGLDAIAALPITHLGMEGCELSEDAFKAFGRMAALEQLKLSNVKMKAEWLMHIANLPALIELNLANADFDDAAVEHLKRLPNLERLALNHTRLGDAGFRELLKLPKLQSLNVDRAKVSKDVFLKAKRDYPDLALYFFEYDPQPRPAFGRP